MTCLNEQPYINPTYYARWKEITEHPDLQYFKWGTMYDAQYATIDPLELDKNFLQAIKQATEACGLIYQKAVSFVLNNKRLLQILGLPPETIEFCSLDYDENMPVTVIGRFDFAVDNKGNIKMLEFNSDTPSGVVETAELNGLISRLNKKNNPNLMFTDNVRAAFQKFTQAKKYENIVFTSLGWHIEDNGTTLAEMDYSGLLARYVSLDKLTVSDDALIDDNSNKIDLLYRLYPIEWFVREEDGVKLLNLVTQKKLDILNPPSAFIAQSKVLQAVIWELASSTDYFSKEEKEIINRYFLPTYLESSYFKSICYVAKPAYGREGGGVYLYNDKGSPDFFVEDQEYEDNMIYQTRTELPEITINTWSGNFTGRLLVGSFLAGGVYSGTFLRVGKEITGNLAYFLPIVCK